MSQLQIVQDSYIGATIISNRFIDEYMIDANDAQLKIYLYLLRMLNAHLGTGISDIADRFNHTEKDVMRALKYWEKRGLLSLEYDEEKNLTGIRMKNLCHEDSTMPSLEETHEASALPEQLSPVRSRKNAKVAEPAGSESSVEPPVAVVATPEPVSMATVVNAVPDPEKEISSPVPTVENAASEISEENMQQLVFLAENYLGHPVSSRDLDSLHFIHCDLGLVSEVVDILLQYCVEHDKKSFRSIAKEAISWKEHGITNIQEARKYAARYNKDVRTIMKQLGRTGVPTDVEIDFIVRWMEEYRFSREVILEACNRTALATGNNRFQYAEGILKSWHGQGVRTLKDVETLDEEHRKASAKAGTGSEGGSGRGTSSGRGKFNQFQQNEYDFAALEKKIVKN